MFLFFCLTIQFLNLQSPPKADQSLPARHVASREPGGAGKQAGLISIIYLFNSNIFKNKNESKSFILAKMI